MSPLWLLAAIIIVALVGALLGRTKAISSVKGDVAALHSRPGYYGSYVFIWTAIPAAVFLAVLLVAQPFFNRSVVDTELRSGYVESCTRAMKLIEGDAEAEKPQICTDREEYEGLDTRRALMQGVVSNVADGLSLLDEETTKQMQNGLVAVRPTLKKVGVALAEDVPGTVVAAAEKLNATRTSGDWVLAGGVALLLIAGFILSFLRINPELRSRNLVEANIKFALILASSIAILTTVGIVLSMLFEALHFFGHVNALDFFFGTTWDPRFSAVGRQVDS